MTPITPMALPGPPTVDISQSPTILLASMFAARRSGDGVLARYYCRRLAAIGIHITFAVDIVESPSTTTAAETAVQS